MALHLHAAGQNLVAQAPQGGCDGAASAPHGSARRLTDALFRAYQCGARLRAEPAGAPHAAEPGPPRARPHARMGEDG